MWGSHRGSPFGTMVDQNQRYNGRISTIGAIKGALSAHYPATIEEGRGSVHTSSSNNDDRLVGESANLVADP